MKSIMQDKDDHTCYLCRKLHDNYATYTYIEHHHVIFNAHNRSLSDKYGLIINLCMAHHSRNILYADEDQRERSKESVHINPTIREMTCIDAQIAFKKRFPDKDFKEIFGINYLQEDL